MGVHHKNILGHGIHFELDYKLKKIKIYKEMCELI